MDLVAFMQEQLEDDEELECDYIEEFVNSKAIDGQSGLLGLERMRIHVSIWKKMFNHVINPTIEKLQAFMLSRFIRFQIFSA